MSFSNIEYPNLELIEYKFMQELKSDEDWKRIINEHKEKNRFVRVDFDIQVFSQLWGSTSTAFDVMEDGSPSFGGQAMTKAYTVVIRETVSNIYGIFIDNKPCYIVKDANEIFFEDLKNRSMKSLSRAKKEY